MAGKPRPIDDLLRRHLAEGASHARAAKACGVNVRTVQRRLECPEFRKSVHDLRNSMIHGTLGLLSKSSRKAAETLEALLKSESPAVQLGAARAILESLLRLRADSEFEARLAEMERRTAQLAGGGT